MKKIEIRLSFMVLAIFSIALGYTEQFFILFLAVSLHEASHMAAATFFKLPVRRLIVTPLGQMAVISELESETAAIRAAVYLAGPLASFMLFSFFAVTRNPALQPYATANLALCLVNLLPVYPLDGGQLCRLCLGNTLGIVRANRVLTVIGRGISVLLMLIGLVQSILFPYNISLYCVGFFLLRASGREYVNMTYAFYRNIFSGTRRQSEKKILPVKMVVAHQNAWVKSIVNRLCWDHFLTFYVTDGEKIVRYVTEDEVVKYVSIHGLMGRLGDIGGEGADSCQSDSHPLY